MNFKIIFINKKVNEIKIKSIKKNNKMNFNEKKLN